VSQVFLSDFFTPPPASGVHPFPQEIDSEMPIELNFHLIRRTARSGTRLLT
jgi:hypothetical protein